MFAIIGLVVVFGAILGGFIMEHGPLPVLVQPAELVIIGGAAAGTLLVGNPLPVVIKMFKGLIGVMSGSKYSKTFYLESLKLLNDIFTFARKSGMAKLEEDVENPEKSAVFSKYPKIIKDHHILHFVCDTLRTAVSGVVPPHDLDAMIENDIDIHHHEALLPAKALSTVSDALPGLGIVAAVLGVVITMGALGGPPEEIGHKVAAALVGTFLGILLCYGVGSPLASNLEKMIDAEGQFYQMLRAGLMAFARGMAPMIAVEFARRAIPHDLRPSFKDMEAACKGGAAAAKGCVTVAQPPQQIIIIRKKKGGHAGHHGGAWKVAYADFVTAMMALFIVLWLLSSSEQVQKAVGGYFTDPNGHGKDVGNGLRGAGSESLPIHKDDMKKLKEKLEQAVKDTGSLERIKQNIVITVTGEGLRIELIEEEKGTFFESGSANPTGYGQEVLKTLAEEIGKLPNKITMEGHTDAKPFAGRGGYSNWELSADRANGARRWMQEQGVRPDQVTQVRGFADQSPRMADDPENPANRRITLIIQYQRQEAPAPEEKSKTEEKKPAPAHH